MHISIVYSNKVSFRHLKKKSKKFFAGTEYSHRNGVFVHRQKDCFFSLDKNTIYIHVPDDDPTSQGLVNKFLSTLFDKTFVGVSGIGESDHGILETLNYVLI